MDRGKFIVFEGIDGSGKTTQIARLKQILMQHGYNCVAEREPSYGVIGSTIRDAVKMNRSFHPDVLSLLFAADRLEHVTKEILPKLEEGVTVLCDRFLLSNLAYQGLHTDIHQLLTYNAEVMKLIVPDLTVFIDTPVEVCMRRLLAESGKLELFETADTLTKVKSNYLNALNLLDYNVAIVSGDNDFYNVTNNIINVLQIKMKFELNIL